MVKHVVVNSHWSLKNWGLYGTMSLRTRVQILLRLLPQMSQWLACVKSNCDSSMVWVCQIQMPISRYWFEMVLYKCIPFTNFTIKNVTSLNKQKCLRAKKIPAVYIATRNIRSYLTLTQFYLQEKMIQHTEFTEKFTHPVTRKRDHHIWQMVS